MSQLLKARCSLGLARVRVAGYETTRGHEWKERVFNTLTDVTDTRRALRLELAVILLIVFEFVIALYRMVADKASN